MLNERKNGCKRAFTHVSCLSLQKTQRQCHFQELPSRTKLIFVKIFIGKPFCRTPLNIRKLMYFYIITEHDSLHKKKQFDWTLRGHDP